MTRNQTGVHHVPHILTLRVASVFGPPGERPLSPWRLLDAGLALLALLYFLPLILVAALALWLAGGGPVILVQPREDAEGHRLISRFRVMRIMGSPAAAPANTPGSAPDSEAEGPAPLRNFIPGPTGVGLFLWRTRIDCLPMLFDVLAGRSGLINPHLPFAFADP